MALSISRHKEILSKHLCQNFFQENRIPVFCGDFKIEEGDEWIRLLNWGSEFSSYKIELGNQVTQNDVTPQVTNLKIFIEIFISRH